MAITRPAPRSESPSGFGLVSEAADIQLQALPEGAVRCADLAAALALEGPVLVVARHPLEEIALRLQTEAATQTVLAQWAEEARARLQLLRGARRRVTVVRAAPLQARDADLTLAVAERLGQGIDGMELALQPVAAEALLMAAAAVRADAGVEALVEEGAALLLGAETVELGFAQIDDARKESADLRDLVALLHDQVGLTQSELARIAKARSQSEEELRAELGRLAAEAKTRVATQRAEFEAERAAAKAVEAGLRADLGAVGTREAALTAQIAAEHKAATEREVKLRAELEAARKADLEPKLKAAQARVLELETGEGLLRENLKLAQQNSLRLMEDLKGGAASRGPEDQAELELLREALGLHVKEIERLTAEMHLAEANAAALRHRSERLAGEVTQARAAGGEREADLMAQILADGARLQAAWTELSQTRAELDKVLNSRSWRVTSVLRRK